MRVWLLAGLLLFGSCDGRAQGIPPDRRAAAQRAAEETIREVAPGPVTFRTVTAFAQATPRAVAVCGQVRIGAGSFLPFVALVTYWDDESEGGTVRPLLATTEEGAARITEEVASRCRDRGGPRPGGLGPLPSIRDDEILRQPDARRSPSETSPQTLPPSSARGSGTGGGRPGDTVTSRLAASVRSSPDGRGTVIGTLRAGTSVTIQGTALGGWYEVADSSGLAGWVHGSRLFGRP